MKIRKDFVTNSSSSSFVVSKESLTQEQIEYIEKNFVHITSSELLRLCQECEVDDIYYLVDYDKSDTHMHTWVKRDECMCDDYIDDVLYDNDCMDVTAKFDYHY